MEIGAAIESPILVLMALEVLGLASVGSRLARWLTCCPPVYNRNHLLMKVLQASIIRFDSLPSTNTEAVRQAVQGAPEGLCVVANEQTAGRGRLQRQWISPRGAGLYFSIVLRPQMNPSIWSLYTLMASLAVHDALLEACSLQTDIKWPNDILVNDRKLGGILGETVDTALGRALIVGIGINLNASALPPDLHETATSVQSAAGEIPDVEGVLQSLVRALERRYEMLQSVNGSRDMIRQWSARSSYAFGKHVRVANGSETFAGVTRGLGNDGALHVETHTGELRIVRAGDVTSVRLAADGQ